jgi:DNA-binding MarR family transcriptional regulator
MTENRAGMPAPTVERGQQFALAIRALTLVFTRYRALLGDRYNVGPSAGAALGRLHIEGPQTPSQLASWLGVSTATTTEILDRLERARLVTRAPHPTDRRKLVITLTDPARELISHHLLAPLTAILNPVLARYDVAAQDAIIHALHGATDALERAVDEFPGTRATTGSSH